MRGLLIALILISQVGMAQNICPGLFYKPLSPQEKAVEFNSSGLAGVFELIGLGPTKLLFGARGAAKTILKSVSNYSIAFQNHAYEKGSAVLEKRLKDMLGVGINSIYDNLTPEEIGKIRIFAFADTVAIKHMAHGYMWTGALMQFGNKFYEFRFEVGLNDIGEPSLQKDTVEKFEMNLLHGLMKHVKNPKDESNILAYLGSLNDNLQEGQIKINQLQIDEVTIENGSVKARVPAYQNGLTFVNGLFEMGLAGSLIVKEGKLIDPPSMFFKKNIIVGLNSKNKTISDLKAEFDNLSDKVKSAKVPDATFVVPIEVTEAGIEPHLAKIAALNQNGITVWLFYNPTGNNANNRSLEQRLQERIKYVENFFGKLYIF